MRGRRIAQFNTSARLFDRQEPRGNAKTMAGRAAALGVLCLHVKTINLREALPQADRFTVSTREGAQYVARVGYRDILYAVGITTDKLARVAAL